MPIASSIGHLFRRGVRRPFAAREYWETRHRLYRGGLRAVADVRLSDLSLGRRFDVITVIDVFSHIVDEAEWRATLASLARHLQTDGVMIIADWVDVVFEPAPEHCVCRSMKRYLKALGKAGLCVGYHQQFKLEHEGETEQLLAARHREL